MTTPYVDPQSIHNPATGTSPPALWGDTVRDDLEFLARPPGCVVQTTANQSGSTANDTWYNVSWNGTDLRDTDGYHAAGSDQLIIPTGLGGWYHLSGSILFDANGTGSRQVRYTINAAGDNRMAVIQTVSATYGTRVPFSQDILLSAGDVLRVSGRQNSGGTLMIVAGCVASLRLVALAD